MRFVIIGTSGAGKSSFAQSLAERLGAKYIELDALFWTENWTPVDSEEFKRRVLAATDTESWVADGNYSVVRAELWSRATDLIWLNFSRFTVFTRIIRRTFARTIRRQELWAGNRESFAKSFFSKDSILLWSFTTFGKNRSRYGELRDKPEPEFRHLRWHELRRPSQAREFLKVLGIN